MMSLIEPLLSGISLTPWTEWKGGPCPVDENSYPQVLLASGEEDCERASDFQWEWSEEYPGDNVVAYRVID